MDSPPYAPHAEANTNFIYNLLFCDDASAFAPRPGKAPAPWQTVLLSEPPNTAALQALAEDSSQEGRNRYLAYRKLRTLGCAVPARQLFGVITEMPLPGGLDTLAAYSDGGVRYIHQTGKMAFLEQVPALQSHIRLLFAASLVVVARIGPWDRPRRPPPKPGGVRITFLVSDGLYFGEGPMSAMQKEALAGPVIQRATELLQALVKLTKK